VEMQAVAVGEVGCAEPDPSLNQPLGLTFYYSRRLGGAEAAQGPAK
jgi:hypothetical protein